MTSAGRFTRASTCAIVNVLPDPVTPSRTCALSPREAFDELVDRLRLVARAARNRFRAETGQTQPASEDGSQTVELQATSPDMQS